MTKSLIIFLLFLKTCAPENNEVQKKDNTKKEAPKEQVNYQSVKNDKTSDDTKFLSFWQDFTSIIKKGDKKSFKEISIDSLKYEQKNIHVETFVKSYFYKIFDRTLITRLSNKDNVNFADSVVYPYYFSPFVLQQLKKGNQTIKEVNIIKVDNHDGNPEIIMLSFVETKNGYKFFGYDKVGG